MSGETLERRNDARGGGDVVVAIPVLPVAGRVNGSAKRGPQLSRGRGNSIPNRVDRSRDLIGARR
jgi:hypothetical protein